VLKNFDVVVAGAGIVGLSIAYQIARRSRLRIAVLEKGAGVGEGSTGASSAICRTRYSRDEMLALARDGIAAYRNWQAFTGIAEPAATFQRDGVLWMPGDDLSWAAREHARMARQGIATEVLDAAELAVRFPALSPCTCGVDAEDATEHDCTDSGSYLLETDGGYIDPVSAAQDLVAACRTLGVTVQFNAPLADVEVTGGRVTGVTLANGAKLATPVLVNAAGPWCPRLYAAAGIAIGWDLRPTRIQMLYRDRPTALAGAIPVTLDMASGIYFRTQNRGQQLVVGSVLEADEREEVIDPDLFAREADEAFKLAKLHALHHRLPALPYRGQVRSYCGLYTVNRDDVHPIVGATALPGFWVANGFSGHGFKLAPAIGALIARSLTGDQSEFDTDVSADFLAVDRTPIALSSKSVLA
jgi:sarcosine oxidase, subunit beta